MKNIQRQPKDYAIFAFIILIFTFLAYISNNLIATTVVVVTGLVVTIMYAWKQLHFDRWLQKTRDYINDGNRIIIDKIKEVGFKGILEATIADLFKGRSLIQWLYLIILGLVAPLGVEVFNTGQHDPVSIIASVTGIICVILVA